MNNEKETEEKEEEKSEYIEQLINAENERIAAQIRIQETIRKIENKEKSQ